MNTILFLSGAGVGALISTCLVLWSIAGSSRRHSETHELYKANHEALMREWCERNALLATQNSILNRIAAK